MTYTPINKGQFTLETAQREQAFERNRGFGVEEAYAENRRQWTDYPKTQHVADYPPHVDIELASVCNLRCAMCYTITSEFKKRVNAKLMDYDLFTKIVDQCADGGVYSIRLSFRGESFLHKRVVDCVKYAKDKGIQEVSSLTNGVKMDEGMFTALMESGMDWLTFSIDGMGETYESIRKPAKFDRMVEKLTNFKRLRDQAGRVKPVIKVQTIFPAIQDDPESYYKTFQPISDMVSSNPLIDYLRNDNPEQILYHEDFSCPQLYQRLVIGADGTSMMCTNDEDNEYVVGDANSQAIHEIWHGEAMTEARRLHREHLGHIEISPCRKCYLPRRTVDDVITMGGREIAVANYINRSQKIGK